jgi:hypothetical protein
VLFLGILQVSSLNGSVFSDVLVASSESISNFDFARIACRFWHSS